MTTLELAATRWACVEVLQDSPATCAPQHEQCMDSPGLVECSTTASDVVEVRTA